MLLMALEIQGLEDVMEESDKTKESKEKLDEAWLKRDKRARNLICTSLVPKVLRKVWKETTAVGVLSALDREYQNKSLPNRIYLKQKFASFKMDEHKDMEENVDNFLKLVADLASLNIEISDEDQAIQILASLPSAYETLKDALKYGNKAKTLTLDDVVNAAYSKEIDLKEKGNPSKTYNEGEGLYVQAKGKSKINKAGTTCFRCGKMGHWKRECPEKKRQTESANVVTGPEQPLVLTISQETTSDWVLDSGCTFHITPNKDLMFDLEDVEGGRVLMANNTHSEIKGVGKIKITNPDGSVVILTGVRYMPDISRNLISYGMLEKAGCKYTGGDFKVIFTKDGRHVISGQYKDGLYFLDGTVGNGEVNLIKEKTDMTKIWHSRLAHMSLQNMNILAKGGYLPSKDMGALEFCEDCVLGKSHKQSFESGKHTTKDVLEYVHSDMWGSSSTPESLGGCKYFLSFIDDFSRKVWVFFLKSKDEAFSVFKSWKERVETQKMKKIKYLRTDNGLEFCNTLFDKLCTESGITRHKTCTYTPQQNGVAERMNRTIMNKVRCMLTESGLGEEFWAEATATATYLINRSPCSSVNFKLPEELWRGSKVTLNHLKRFGCSAYVHIVQGKTEPRAVKGYFVGYPYGVKGYRVWIPEDGKCTTSRNVVFNEEEVFKTLMEQKQNVQQGVNIQPAPIVEAKATCESSDARSSESEEQRDTEPEIESVESDEDELEGLDLNNYILARDRKRRQNIKRPSKYEEGNYVAYALAAADDLDVAEPKSFQDAMKGKKQMQWKGATDEEMDSLDRNNTWELIDKPPNAKVVGCKWIFTLKQGIPNIEDLRFKARLVAKGYSQQEGVDYNEVFSPVVKHVSIRILLSIVVNRDYELEQMDVKTAFLHGNLEERVLMDQPEGYVKRGSEEKVCLLKKSLYGLKQSPRQWNIRFDMFMKEQNFIRSKLDPCVYMRNVETDQAVYLLLYVDDMLIASGDTEEIRKVKESLSTEFEMKDLGKASRILGMDIVRDRNKGKLVLSQEHYIKKILKTFGMGNSKEVTTPIATHFKLKAQTEEEREKEIDYMDRIPYASVVGSLMYAMIGTRPDLGYAVGLISRYMAHPGKVHWEAAKWVLRYLRGETSKGILFQKANSECNIEGFCDSDYATDLDKRRSVTGYIFKVWGNTVSWKSCLQSVVALSTTEAEYMALTAAVKEAIWLKGLCEEMGLEGNAATIRCDSQSALALAKNSVHHERTKHISTKYHFIRDIIAEGGVQLSKVHTNNNAADFLTKALPGPKFHLCCELVNLGC